MTLEHPPDGTIQFHGDFTDIRGVQFCRKVNEADPNLDDLTMTKWGISWDSVGIYVYYTYIYIIICIYIYTNIWIYEIYEI